MVLTEADHADLQPGDEAPAFRLPDTDGTERSLSELGASTDAVLLVFTCNHCPYAKAKMPTLNRIAADYDDVAVVGVNPNDADEYPEDSADRMAELVADGTVAYDAYLRDDTQRTAAAYGAVCTPDPFLLDTTTDVPRVAYRGRLDDATNPDDEPSGEPGFEVRAVIDRLLDGERVTEAGEPARGCSIKWLPGNAPQ